MERYFKIVVNEPFSEIIIAIYSHPNEFTVDLKKCVIDVLNYYMSSFGMEMKNGRFHGELHHDNIYKQVVGENGTLIISTVDRSCLTLRIYGVLCGLNKASLYDKMVNEIRSKIESEYLSCSGEMMTTLVDQSNLDTIRDLIKGNYS